MKALVTGGSHGISVAIARNLQHAGHSVTICSRNDPLTSESGLEWIKCDVLSMEQIDAVKVHVETCDILINCVGGGGRYGTVEEVLQKNFWAMGEFTAWALAGMAADGWGRVVTISSIFGREVGAPREIFTAAKAAQIAFMKALSRKKDYVRRGITFNTVCPGNVYVEGKPRVDEEALPLGRMGTPEEVAKLVAFLCSNDAAYINGAVINIDGGESVAI